MMRIWILALLVVVTLGRPTEVDQQKDQKNSDFTNKEENPVVDPSKNSAPSEIHSRHQLERQQPPVTLEKPSEHSENPQVTKETTKEPKSPEEVQHSVPVPNPTSPQRNRRFFFPSMSSSYLYPRSSYYNRRRYYYGYPYYFGVYGYPYDYGYGYDYGSYGYGDYFGGDYGGFEGDYGGFGGDYGGFGGDGFDY